MNKLLFHNIPLGATGERIPQAAVASAQTSKELVKREEGDSAYFRRLEEGGILLNRPQIAAVRHHKGPLLTLAGAGSGKTSVLICRTGYLLSVRGVSPSQLLLLTFSSKAAAEMRERIALLPGVSTADVARLQARTFHSFFLFFLRRQGLQQEIFSETRRQHILLKQIMRELGLPKDAYPPETLLSLLSSCKMNMGTVEDLPESTTAEKEMKSILEIYEQWKLDNFKIDFDDVLLIAYRMLKERPVLLQELQMRYLYVMVDEFQDTNALQYELVKMVAHPQHNLMVVGDDDQTIYSFNGARSEFILEFEKLYPGAKVITLDINYRSGPAIVGLGNGIIRHNTRRRSKTLQAAKGSGSQPRYMRPQTADEEAEQMIEHILNEVSSGKREYSDFAMLYRASSSNRAVLELLLLRDIPYIDYGEGQLLYEHWLISPVLDHLRLSVNRRNFAAMENILPTLYMNREKGMNHIRQMEARQPKQGPLIHLLSMPGMEDFKGTKLRDRLDLIRNIRELTPIQAIRQIRTQFYDYFIEANERHQATLHRETLKEMLDELESSAARFDSIPAFLDFIDNVTERNEHNRQPGTKEQGNRIALMTIHKSKGLEFPVVFLIGASEGILPHSSALEGDRLKDRKLAAGSSGASSLAALEEERRLAYVAVTRAREELFISSPAQHRGKKAEVSRFMLSAFRSAVSSTAATTVGRAVTTRTVTTRALPTSRTTTTKTHVVPVWNCTGSSCPGWTRMKAGGAEDHLTSKPCPLCSSPMAKDQREVPV
ncbi:MULTISPECIES: UvrD-helicase domain-containing protein [Paenibacillus]|uniref:UvrD-helicase domain-containing protein n=1 Tax=Paenibacillus TaxID=44249 RepID=UPI0004F901EA|nr:MULTISPECIES: UvrD-helicase domain-containing protein [Paenibacillus]AIQ33448.1 ATP-dependent DNA helicase UvrD [Paenibacillus sp. FSL R5-0345]